MNVTITPYDDKFHKAEVIDWLQAENVMIPLNAPIGRYPTPKELRAILDGFSDCTIEYKVTSIHWMADIQCGKSRVSIIVAFSGSEDDPFDYLSFGEDYEKLISIVKKLSQICGTFLLLHDGESPILILPE
jgi:hypothetical protein